MPRKRKAPPTSAISDEALDLARQEAAELMGLNPETLTAGDRLKCDLISALRAAVDDELGKISSANAADLGKLIVAVETLTRFLADAKPKGDEKGAIYKRDPAVVMEEMVARFIAARDASRAEQGLSPQICDLAEQQRRIDALEAENAALRALPAPEDSAAEPITPADGDIVPPGERSDLAANQRYSVGAGTPPKPPRTINGKVIRPGMDDDGNPIPPQACSGEESKRRMARVNSDYATVHREMTRSSRVAHEPTPSTGPRIVSGSGELFRRSW